ncbi:transglutaminase family protein [Alphaproteobacteria bacterium KMM 3653]|uniref:Transglutaminase family protein n=1 Tax=Harenicola maris TaxID=2841044 RepID=A0AAP2CQK2_9RHOB|nr:transglutaminase family protein [Harenicola maris]
MRLRISHVTSYTYEEPVPYGLQQLRLRPKSRPNQTVLDWKIEIEGGKLEVGYEDEHANNVDLISFHRGETDLTVRCSGEVEVTDAHGIIGPHQGFVPLWLFQRQTTLTQVGPEMQKLVDALPKADQGLPQLHALMNHVLDSIPYSTDQTATDLSAEMVIYAGQGVCQDHTHVFLAAARALGYPARYVSGYLMMEGQTEQNASHAWAEAHVQGIGWVGFDVSNAISPDDRYVRVATGLDYGGAAPVQGLHFGQGREQMQVALQVQQ